MNDALFADLLESVSEAGAYLRGETTAARVTFVGKADPRAIREQLEMTQEQLEEQTNS